MMNERQRVVAEALLALRLRRLIRVDDDLYCDPSYITHAEYQLFLDEKRDEGKYFQPDHWLGYTFPKGQGGSPVVGVRPRDAVAFCGWLTRRDRTAIVGGWCYRLPNSGELVTYDLHTTETPGMVRSYWTQSSDGFAFTRIGKSYVTKMD